MKLSEINIRDPFILVHNQKYYLYTTAVFDGKCGFGFYVSEDLENYSPLQPCFLPTESFWADREYWAPEVHEYNGRFYLFATFHSGDRNRSVQILRAEKPEGPFTVWSEPVTPPEQMCLDGTLFAENGKPYMVYCHEWLQCVDGEMCITELSADLKSAVGESKLLFKASESGWAVNIGGGIITDGPFFRRLQDGKLLMLWSSFPAVDRYAVGAAVSESGSVFGPWQHIPAPLFDENGGHCMIFRTLKGEERLLLHCPNHPGGEERAAMFEIYEIDRSPYLHLKKI